MGWVCKNIPQVEFARLDPIDVYCNNNPKDYIVLIQCRVSDRSAVCKSVLLFCVGKSPSENTSQAVVVILYVNFSKMYSSPRSNLVAAS